MKQISFVAETGGDGECFCWDNLSKQDKVGVVGESEYENTVTFYRSDDEFDEEYEQMLQVELKRLYPDTVMNALEVKEGRKYRFTISVEEMP